MIVVWLNKLIEKKTSDFFSVSNLQAWFLSFNCCCLSVCLSLWTFPHMLNIANLLATFFSSSSPTFVSWMQGKAKMKNDVTLFYQCLLNIIFFQINQHFEEEEKNNCFYVRLLVLSFLFVFFAHFKIPNFDTYMQTFRHLNIFVLINSLDF